MGATAAAADRHGRSRGHQGRSHRPQPVRERRAPAPGDPPAVALRLGHRARDHGGGVGADRPRAHHLHHLSRSASSPHRPRPRAPSFRAASASPVGARRTTSCRSRTVRPTSRTWSCCANAITSRSTSGSSCSCGPLRQSDGSSPDRRHTPQGTTTTVILPARSPASFRRPRSGGGRGSGHSSGCACTALLLGRGLDALEGEPFVGDHRQQVAHEVEAGGSLVVGLDDPPR